MILTNAKLQNNKKDITTASSPPQFFDSVSVDLKQLRCSSSLISFSRPFHVEAPPLPLQNSWTLWFLNLLKTGPNLNHFPPFKNCNYIPQIILDLSVQSTQVIPNSNLLLVLKGWQVKTGSREQTTSTCTWTNLRPNIQYWRTKYCMHSSKCFTFGWHRNDLGKL